MAYVVLLNGGELDRYDDLESAITRANECTCQYPGAHVEIAVYRNGLRISTALSIPTAIDAVLSDWGPWFPTQDWSTCVAGTQTRVEQRTRMILIPPENGGVVAGNLWELRTVSQDCVVPPAPVNCVLSAWGAWTPITDWGACVADVQERTEQRTRTIVTQPETGGTACGALVEQRVVEQACSSPVDCVVSAFGAWEAVTGWSACIADEQSRTEQRTRTVTTQPANGGATCPVLMEERVVTQACETPEPDVDCVLSAWSAWAPTSAWSACVADEQSRTEQRTRTIDTFPTGNGVPCGPLTESRVVTQACLSPVDCVLSAFGAWIPDSAWGPCVNNSQSRTETRTRTIVTQPANGGAACGPLSEQRTVNQACLSPVDCVLSSWGAWVPDSNWGPCVNGTQSRTETRTRTVVTAPANGGAPCGPLSEQRTVNQACTPVIETSPNGFTVPEDGPTLIGPDLAEWTFQGGTPTQSAPLLILKAGAWWHFGEGFKLKIWNGVIYAEAGDGWWRDTPTEWVWHGPDPETGTPTTSEGLVMTTGSIDANSKVLTVADPTGFSVDDWIIGEIGKEPGLGQRNTLGVGGQWPSESAGRPSLSAAISEFGSAPAGDVYIWINDSGSGEYGYVYWGRQYGWIWLGDLNWYPFTQSGDYYAALRAPRSLQAQIESIAGNDFTLKNGPTGGFAKVSVINMTVYRDEILDINGALGSGNLQLTAGDHAVGGVVHIDNATGRIFEGATSDRTETRIFTPKGVACIGIDIENAPGTIIRNLTVQGNWRDHGFGYNYGDGPVAHYEAARGVQAASDFAYSLSVGIRANPGSDDTEFINVQAIDMPVAQFSTAYCSNVWATDCDARYTDPLRQYMQWAYYWTDASGGGGLRCTCSGSYMFPGFESFKSSNVSYIDCGGIGTVSFNGSHSWLLQNFNGVYPANSCVNTPSGIGTQQPIVNVNNNINMPPSFLSPGGHINGMTLNQQGYVNGGNTSMLCGVKVQGSNPNVLIEGFTNICPNYVPGAPWQGAQAIDSAGPNFIVRNSTFHGKAYWTPQNNAENKAVVFTLNANSGACTGLVLPDDPNSKFLY